MIAISEKGRQSFVSLEMFCAALWATLSQEQKDAVMAQLLEAQKHVKFILITRDSIIAPPGGNSLGNPH